MQKSPADCASMADIRAEIDRLDKALMSLFAERWTYIERAAEIKKPAGLKADIPPRVDEVRRNARKNAEAAGLDPDFYEDIWARLIQHSIVHEQAVLGETDI
ncbi:chorismate mutase [Pararhizobium polonicum]|uniref:chorismate mutase n=1 Tax=Pararhizobium polonicum TaxID=1612624 RepID=A0A1C7P5Y6_9HYPH|nr:chorismate mutase family protein [Pararhizobium polonicum]OBZ96669.1 chorismate mutase [Pararhizobium polonicum]